MKNLEMKASGVLDVFVVDIPERLGRGDAIGQCEMLAKKRGGSSIYTVSYRDNSHNLRIVPDFETRRQRR